MTTALLPRLQEALKRAVAQGECDSCNETARLCSGCSRCLSCCHFWRELGQSECEEDNGMWIDTNGCDEHFHCFHRDEEGKWTVRHADNSECEEAECNLADREAA